ncbi:MAG TPA: sigma 54-interacting transcriptional regulator, partial [Desulfobacteria bacterium]|nr:sigma 54-interacting transcriptional regulator [Desulfobacteria bacterium]
LGMVVAAVYAIESQLRLHKATNRLYMAYKHSNIIMESISEGLVSVDSNGCVTHLNGIGSEILGIDLNESKGKNIEELVKTKLPMMDVLRTGKGYIDREMMFENERGKKHFTSTTTPLFNENGEVIGVTATLREMKTVQQSVSKFPGVQASFTFDHIIGRSSTICDALSMAKLAASSVSTVLLNGESGTGKELFAQSIHNASSRQTGPFVAINCGALPRDLIESELFGYEEGAFTGARKGGHLGKFELASGGTIFLDEIGDMPLEVQVKLLRVLQERQITRLGGQKTIPVDIRIIAATNQNLGQLVEEGDFRADLFYRLNVMSITIPPLRDRDEDIILITQNLVTKISKMFNRRVVRISTQFMQAVKKYPWPGNIRQLENVLERSINLVDKGILELEHLPEEIRPKLKPDTKQKKDEQEEPSQILPLWIIEKNAIEQALHLSGGKIIKAAKALGIGRNTLHRKIKEYGINSEDRGCSSLG